MTLPKYDLNVTNLRPYHRETSQLTWKENQLTGLYMIGNIGR